MKSNKKFGFLGIHIFILSSFLFLFFVNTVSAATSHYRSADWVGSEGDPPFTSLDKCQATDDQYCSRIGAPKGAVLYFGSFPDLESFGIPLNSTLDKLRIRINGKGGGVAMLVAVEGGYNQIPAKSSCQKPSYLLDFYMSPNNKVVEFNLPLTISNGLINCMNLNNINFRNLTFRIGPYSNSGFAAEIDNFEIAFDYTPPAVTPTPVSFTGGQKGTVWEIGPDKTNLNLVQNLNDIVSVAVGEHYNIGLKSDGSVWTWQNGNTNFNQLQGENGVRFLTDVKKITAGENYGMAIKEDNTAWYWSQGPGGIQNPIQVKYLGISMQDIVDIAAGDGHFLVLKSDGTVYGWGGNSQGQVGIGCTGGNCSSISSPRLIGNFVDIIGIAAGGLHSLAIKKDGTVWGWGRTYEGQLGNNAVSGGTKLSPFQVIELSGIKKVSAKTYYSMALSGDGKVYTWGGGSTHNPFPLSVPVQAPDLQGIEDISSGAPNFSFGVKGHVIKSDGTLWQLYINDIPPKQVPHLKDVVAVASGEQTPSLAVINSTGEVLGDSTGPFLDLPWDYKGNGMSFSDSALAINSYFDHSYPLLSTILTEPVFTTGLFDNYDPRNQITTYLNEKSSEKSYSKHDGYDYGKSANVKHEDDLLAAASGSAKFVDSCGACGNAIHIDHGNYFQTRYYHLGEVEPFIHHSALPVPVEAGQKIGEVGFTGRVLPQGEAGAHIHFMVIEDKNKDGNFEDNIPDGLTDPFGWQPPIKDTLDPWEKYAFTQFEIARTGNKSSYLWKNLLTGMKAFVTSIGGTFNTGRYSVTLPKDSISQDLTLELNAAPSAQISATLSSIGPTLEVTLRNPLGDLVTFLTKPIFIVIDLGEEDLLDYKPGTIAIYSSKDRIQWKKEKTTLDLENKKATAEVDHLTYFALVGEPADTIAPSTDIEINNNDGELKWFSSDIDASLVAQDNAEGSGVEYIAYKIGDDEWQTYSIPVNFTHESKYKLQYYAEDNAGNIEDVKTAEFQIDKTAPSTKAVVSGTEGLSGWYVSDVKINLDAKDNASGISRSEYSLNGGETYLQYEGEVVLNDEGAQEMSFRSVDNAGNIEEAKELSIKIDKTPPSTLVYTSGLRGEDNWYRSNVEVALNGNDEISEYKTSFYSLDSGENYDEYIDPIIIGDEGDFEIFYYSVDNAGNLEEKKSIEIRIDKTSPVVSISANPDILWPANGKMVDVKLDGDVDENNLLKTTFNVSDEYNLIKPILSQFGHAIKLEARRDGSDMDGRIYTIEALSEDLAGNRTTEETQVIVPHDQGLSISSP